MDTGSFSFHPGRLFTTISQGSFILGAMCWPRAHRTRDELFAQEFDRFRRMTLRRVSLDDLELAWSGIRPVVVEQEVPVRQLRSHRCVVIICVKTTKDLRRHLIITHGHVGCSLVSSQGNGAFDTLHLLVGDDHQVRQKPSRSQHTSWLEVVSLARAAQSECDENPAWLIEANRQNRAFVRIGDSTDLSRGIQLVAEDVMEAGVQIHGQLPESVVTGWHNALLQGFGLEEEFLREW